MKRINAHPGAIALLVAVLLAPAAMAQTAADALPNELLDCADIEDVLQRLACYDREIATLRETPAAAPAKASEPPAQVPEAEPATTASAGDARETDEPGEFTATVVDITRRPRGEMIIVLDNEQVWEQKHADTRFRLDVGDTATVRKSAFGGYRLFGDGNRSIQVERTQ